MTNKQSKSRIIEPQFLLMAYCNGYFPMADSKSGEIGWYSPDPRTIFELDEFKIPRSLRLTIKKNPFEIRLNTGFEEVMRKCGEREETWISEEIIQSYVELFRLGYAHSIETWKENKLVGGLYGVSIGGAFFGESMFSRERDASKVALVYLVERMKARGFELLDTQFITQHLARFGAREIPREEYLERLKKAIEIPTSFI
ncbi:MAG: leucyl/phenylalanyl-tRNA--protein transferase [Ignavibacteriales bacterium]|nr:leucyl/phenylalanyl-tRNA--protein transferase [Ignavibacteriales bacterium]MBI3787986.1 leucyl/phenylalanyl-tRNA--protein transferase [Ignavibacteriales bacterium]